MIQVGLGSLVNLRGNNESKTIEYFKRFVK